MTENTENFEALLDQSLKKIKNFEGKVVTGKVISMDHNHALIDVGLKSEGRISINELKFCDKENEIGLLGLGRWKESNCDKKNKKVSHGKDIISIGEWFKAP